MRWLTTAALIVSTLLGTERVALAQDSSSGSVTITMTDTEFRPAGVVIPPGGSVTWLNQGSRVHTATTIGGAPLPFDTGGLGAGQSKSFSFGLPGDYYYTSATDCPKTGGNNPAFPCSISYVVSVVQPGEVTAAAPVAATIASQSGWAWRSKDINDPPVNCGPAQRFLGWLPPHQTPCSDSAPNAGTQYVQGHVMDRNGKGVGGMIVRASIYGNNYDATSDQDGTFSIVLSVSCPIEDRVYSVFIIDGRGQQSSDVRSVNYSNCNIAGEFHFDFVNQL